LSPVNTGRVVPQPEGVQEPGAVEIAPAAPSEAARRRRSIDLRKLLPLLAIGVATVFVPEILGGNAYLIGVAATSLFFALYASGWNVVAGFAGQFSFGHSAFVGIGAYVSTMLFITYGWSPTLTILIGAVFGGIVAVLTGIPFFRLRGPYYALTTIAFSEILRLVVSNSENIGPFKVGGPSGVITPLAAPVVFGVTLSDNTGYYFAALVMLALVLIATYWMAKSRLGLYWAAIRTDQDAAASLGVPVLRYKSYAAFISGLIVAATGALMALYVGFFDANSVLSIDLSIQIALMGLIGGRATVFGPTIGALVLFPLGEATRAQFGANAGAHLVVYGIVLMLAIYFLPQGVAGIRLRRRRRPSAVEAS
jgi:branched-chain amino acid transport system permease protein